AKLWDDYQAVAFQSVAQLTGDDQALWLDVLRQVNGRLSDVRSALQTLADARLPTEAEARSISVLETTLVARATARIEDDTVRRPAEREIWFHELACMQGAADAELRRESA